MQPRYMPEARIEPWTLQFAGWSSNHWANWRRQCLSFNTTYNMDKAIPCSTQNADIRRDTEDKLIFRFSIILNYFNLLTDGEMTWGLLLLKYQILTTRLFCKYRVQYNKHPFCLLCDLSFLICESLHSFTYFLRGDLYHDLVFKNMP